MLSLFLLGVPSQTPSPALEAILRDRRLDGATVAAVVTDADGRVIFDHGGNLHVMPASNMKLLSNAFALHQLGPGWRPRTRIWKEERRTVVDSQGDPLLNHAKLVDVRTRLGLDRRLPVFVHEEFAPLWSDNWEVGDLPNKFASPVCAFTVDEGSFELWAKKGRAEFVPDAYGTRVVKQSLPDGVKTVYDPFRRIVAAGPSAFTKDGLVDTLSLPRPDEDAAGILGSGFARTDDVPVREPDAIIDGAPISDVVRQCLPPSDNQLAEQLLMLGARREGPLGSDAYASARHRETNFLTRIVGVDPSDLRVDDGSGLSRHNFVTTRAIAQLLAWATHQPTADLWRIALAHSASDGVAGTGTLAHRLAGVTFSGKTGSLDMVAALSGYLETADHQTRIVSIIVNEFACTSTETREIIDRFVRAVAGK